MRLGTASKTVLASSRSRLAGSTALVGLALGAVATLVVLSVPIGSALAAPGLGGAGSGTGGTGGDGGSAPGSAGAAGTAGTGGGTGGASGAAGTGGGGGGGGAGGTTGATSVTSGSGLAGGNGGAGSGASSANAGGGGGGGEGGAGVVSATGGTLSGLAAGAVGGTGGAAGPGATPGNGGDGGEGIVITGASQTLINNGVIVGGIGGGAGGPRATAGTGGPGVLGLGDNLTVVNNGTITGGLNGNGVGRTYAVTFFGAGSNLTNGTTGLINGGLYGVDNLTNNNLIDLNGTDTAVGTLSGTAAGAIIRNGGTLTVGSNGGSTTYAGRIIDGAGQTSFVKTGVGEMILTGANTYTGSTTVSDGVLHVGSGGSITGSPITNNATFLVDAGAAVTSPTIVNNAYLQVDGTVAATTSFTNNAVLAVNAPIATPSFLNSGQVTGLLTLDGLTSATNVAGGYIPNGLSLATTGTASFANDGTVGTGGLVLQNRAGTLSVTNTGLFDGYVSSLAGTATAITNSGTWTHEGASSFAGSATITNSGTFQASGSVTGLSTFTNTDTGLLFVAAPFSGDIATFNNSGMQAAGAGLLLQGRSFPTVTTFNNNGYLRVPVAGGGAADVTLAAATFNNGAKGTIDLTGNGRAGDRLTIAGNYTGTAGSRLAVDANLSPGGSASDVLRVTGTTSGTTTLVVNRLDDPRTGSYSTKTVPVVIAGGGSGQLVLGAPIQGSGVTTFELQSNAPGSYQIVSRIDTSAAAGAPNTFRSLLSSLNIGFFQSMSSLFGYVTPAEEARLSSSVSSGNLSWAQLTTRPAFSEPDLGPSVTPDTMAAGVWANGGGGELVLRGTDTATFAGGATRASASRTEVGFAGVQVGLDAGWFNIDNSGLNVRLGVTGGSVGGTATQTLGTPTRNVFDVPFVGVYAVITDGAFFADVSYRHDFIHGQLTNTLAGLNARKTDLGADTISGTAGYRFGLEDLVGGGGGTFIEPSGTLIYTQTGRLDIPVTGGTVRAGDLDTLLGRIGVRVGTTLRPNGGVVLQPFVSASVWNEFGGAQRTQFVSSNVVVDPGAFVPILSRRLGMFGQAGGGVSLQAADAPVSGFVRGDVRFGDRIEGYAINGGARYQF